MNSNPIIHVPFQTDRPLTDEQRTEVNAKLAEMMANARPPAVDPTALSYRDEMRSRMVKVRRPDTEAGYNSIQYNVRVPGCGDKLNPSEFPRTNCKECWNFYFKLHPGKLAAAQSVAKTMGTEALKQSFGKAFVKQFKRLTQEQDVG
jgi:hypothetical protein